MQNLIYGALFCAILTSCGGSAEEKKEPESFEDKKKAVCDCFKEKPKDDAVECHKMQSDYANSFEDEEEAKKFRLETMDCM
jgi:hypothetical protein